ARGRARGRARSTVSRSLRRRSTPTWPRLDPGAKPHLERMGEEVVAREDADAVVEAAGEAGLHFHAEAVLAVGERSGILQFVGVLDRRAFARAAREQQLDAEIAGLEAVQLHGDFDRDGLAELDARARGVEPPRGDAAPCAAHFRFPAGHGLRGFVAVLGVAV